MKPEIVRLMHAARDYSLAADDAYAFLRQHPMPRTAEDESELDRLYRLRDIAEMELKDVSRGINWTKKREAIQ